MGKRLRPDSVQAAQEEEAGQLIAERERILTQLLSEKKELWKAAKEVRDVEAAQSVLQAAAKKVQDRVHTQLSAIVTKCLRAVFPDPYKFKIVFEKKRGKTEARPVFCRRGMELGPRDQVGGSVLEVTAFALRLGCLMIQRPHRRRLIVMDEPFLTVGERKDNRDRVRSLIEALSKELGVQFILATNSPDMEVGRVVDINRKGKK